jgi:hypothetical protein
MLSLKNIVSTLQLSLLLLFCHHEELSLALSSIEYADASFMVHFFHWIKVTPERAESHLQRLWQLLGRLRQHNNQYASKLKHPKRRKTLKQYIHYFYPSDPALSKRIKDHLKQNYPAGHEVQCASTLHAVIEIYQLVSRDIANPKFTLFNLLLGQDLQPLQNRLLACLPNGWQSTPHLHTHLDEKSYQQLTAQWAKTAQSSTAQIQQRLNATESKEVAALCEDANNVFDNLHALWCRIKTHAQHNPRRMLIYTAILLTLVVAITLFAPEVWAFFAKNMLETLIGLATTLITAIVAALKNKTESSPPSHEEDVEHSELGTNQLSRRVG